MPDRPQLGADGGGDPGVVAPARPGGADGDGAPDTHDAADPVQPADPTQPADPVQADARSLLSSILHDRSARFGLAVVGAIVLLAVGAPIVAALTGHGPNAQFTATAMGDTGLPVGPNREFWLGADGNGRDVLVRVLYGARTSLLVGVPATTLAMLIGTAVGVAAGYFGGRVDRLLSQLTDIALSFPFVVSALSLVTLNRTATGGARLDPAVVVVLVIAAFAWTYYARLTRGLVQDLRSRPFVEAARTLGASDLRIILREVLPSIAPTVAVYWAVQLPQNIVLEATMSFLGIGVRAPNPSWGNIIADAQSSSLYQVQPWYLIAPAIALFLTVLGFNALAGGIRNVLDPHAHTR